MSLSNRTLWVLILTWFILSSFWFYKYFFDLKLTTFNIISNVSNFSWSLSNSKFQKDFFCKNAKCSITEIPPFDYKLTISKNNYIDYKSNIDLWEKVNLEVYLKKSILLEKTNRLTDNSSSDYISNEILLSKIYSDDKFYFHQSKEKLYLSNKFNSNIIEINFTPRISYIKNIWFKNLVIVTEVWSYNFDLNTMKIEYFSLFSDYLKYDGNYIWIINSKDRTRRINFWFEKASAKTMSKYSVS